MCSNLRGITLLAATAAFVTGAAQAQQTIGPAKIAIINAQKAVGETQEIKKAQAALEAKYRPRQQEIESLQHDLQGLQQQLNTPNLPPQREAQLRQDAAEKQKKLQREGEDLHATMTTEER